MTKVSFLSIDDRVINYQDAFKDSDSQRISKLNRAEVKEIIKLIAEVDKELFKAIADKRNGFNAINFGFGTIKVVVREPMPYTDVRTKERSLTSYSPLYYFSPNDKLKAEMKALVNSEIKKEQEIERKLRGEIE